MRPKVHVSAVNRPAQLREDETRTWVRLDEGALVIDLATLAELIAESVSNRVLGLRAETSQWLDVGGAAEHLGCSPERIRKLVAQRRIPHHQAERGGRLHFNRKELDEWMMSL